jgi:hypothetical protein
MENIRRNAMKNVKLDRTKLLEIVKENMLKHIREYNESVEDYKKIVLRLSEANLELAKTGNLDQFKKIERLPTFPVSYEQSYRRAIKMLELSIDTIIEVEEDVFNQLVLDEWTWKNSFVTNSTLYKSVGGSIGAF